MLRFDFKYAQSASYYHDARLFVALIFILSFVTVKPVIININIICGNLLNLMSVSSIIIIVLHQGFVIDRNHINDINVHNYRRNSFFAEGSEGPCTL